MLTLDRLDAGYGAATVLRDCSFQMNEGECISILGKSGSGKSTLLETIFQIHKPLAGSIIFEGQHLEGLPTWRLSEIGLALVPEGRKLFPDHTVLENLRIGGRRLIRQEGERAFDAELHRIFDLFPFVKTRTLERAAYLSGGEQQMVAIARALVARPRLLCLDEPTQGLSPAAVYALAQSLGDVRSMGYSVLFTEQKTGFAAAAVTRVVAIRNGGLEEVDHNGERSW